MNSNDSNSNLSMHLSMVSTFYRQLWQLKVPTKIKITLWRFASNYVPTFHNLQIKRISTNANCPKCASSQEPTTHILLACPFALNIWSHFGISWPANHYVYRC